jgi:hypothetical protein
MSKSTKHALATAGILSVAVVGLALNFVAPETVSTWFGIGTGFAAAAAALVACLTKSRVAVALAVTAVAASVAAGSAGAADLGALAALAILIANDAVDQNNLRGRA